MKHGNTEEYIAKKQLDDIFRKPKRRRPRRAIVESSVRKKQKKASLRDRGHSYNSRNVDKRIRDEKDTSLVKQVGTYAIGGAMIGAGAGGVAYQDADDSPVSDYLPEKYAELIEDVQDDLLESDSDSGLVSLVKEGFEELSSKGYNFGQLMKYNWTLAKDTLKNYLFSKAEPKSAEQSTMNSMDKSYQELTDSQESASTRSSTSTRNSEPTQEELGQKYASPKELFLNEMKDPPIIDGKISESEKEQAATVENKGFIRYLNDKDLDIIDEPLGTFHFGYYFNEDNKPELYIAMSLNTKLGMGSTLYCPIQIDEGNRTSFGGGPTNGIWSVTNKYGLPIEEGKPGIISDVWIEPIISKQDGREYTSIGDCNSSFPYIYGKGCDSNSITVENDRVNSVSGLFHKQEDNDGNVTIIETSTEIGEEYEFYYNSTETNKIPLSELRELLNRPDLTEEDKQKLVEKEYIVNQGITDLTDLGVNIHMRSFLMNILGEDGEISEATVYGDFINADFLMEFTKLVIDETYVSGGDGGQIPDGGDGSGLEGLIEGKTDVEVAEHALGLIEFVYDRDAKGPPQEIDRNHNGDITDDHNIARSNGFAYWQRVGDGMLLAFYHDESKGNGALSAHQHDKFFVYFEFDRDGNVLKMRYSNHHRVLEADAFDMNNNKFTFNMPISNEGYLDRDNIRIIEPLTEPTEKISALELTLENWKGVIKDSYLSPDGTLKIAPEFTWVDVFSTFYEEYEDGLLETSRIKLPKEWTLDDVFKTIDKDVFMLGMKPIGTRSANTNIAEMMYFLTLSEEGSPIFEVDEEKIETDLKLVGLSQDGTHLSVVEDSFGDLELIVEARRQGEFILNLLYERAGEERVLEYTNVFDKSSERMRIQLPVKGNVTAHFDRDGDGIYEEFADTERIYKPEKAPESEYDRLCVSLGILAMMGGALVSYKYKSAIARRFGLERIKQSGTKRPKKVFKKVKLEESSVVVEEEPKARE